MRSKENWEKFQAVLTFRIICIPPRRPHNLHSPWIRSDANHNDVTAQRRLCLLDVFEVVFLEPVDEFSHLLNAAVTNLLQILTQTALYLLLQARFLAATQLMTSSEQLE